MATMLSSSLASRRSLISQGGATRVNANATGTRVMGNAPPAVRRTTMAPSTAQRSSGSARASSVYGLGGTGRTQDPRPISNRAYMTNEAEALVRFLAAHDYDRPVSRESLQSPSKNDFLHILEFLFRLVDPNMKIGPKPEEEVPQFFSNMKYPFKVTKSHLMAVGSPHTWPHLLAALMWLVNLLQYDEGIQQVMNDPENPSSDHMFFVYIGKAYEEFMGGEDNCDEDLFLSLEERNASIREASEQLRGANAAIVEEIKVFESQQPPVEKIRKEKDLLLRDQDKFQRWVHDLENHKISLAETVQKIRVQLEKGENEVASLSKQIADLEHQVLGQEVNVQDFERMSKEKRALEELVQSIEEQRRTLDAKVWEQEKQRRSALDALEASARSYNDLATKLKLLPWNAKHSGGKNMEFIVNTRAVTTSFTATLTNLTNPETPSEDSEEIVNLDLKQVVRPAVQRLKDSYMKKFISAQALALKTEAGLIAKQQTLQETKQNLVPLQERKQKFEELLDETRRDASDRMKQTAKEADMLEGEWKSVRMEGDKQSARTLEEIEEAKATFNELKIKIAQEEKDARERTTIVQRLVEEHRSRILQKLKSFEERLVEKE